MVKHDNVWREDRHEGEVVLRKSPTRLPDEVKNFVPAHLVDEFYVVAVKGYRCVRCDAGMLPQIPGLVAKSLVMKTLGLKPLGAMTNRDGHFCHECEQALEIVQRRCHLCTQPINNDDEIYLKFENAVTEYLCVACYETVPAKMWEIAVSRLLSSRVSD